MKKPKNNVVHLDIWKKSKEINNMLTDTTENEIEETKATINYLESFPSFYLDKATLDSEDNKNTNDISTILAFLFVDHLSELQGEEINPSDETIKSLALFIKDTVNVEDPIDQGDSYLYEIKPEEIEYWKKHLASLEGNINKDSNSFKEMNNKGVYTLMSEDKLSKMSPAAREKMLKIMDAFEKEDE